MTTVMTHEGKIGETRAIRPLVAGNWKMNGLVASLNEAGKVADRMAEAGFKAQTDVMICPPATLILPLAARANSTKAGASKLIVGTLRADCLVKTEYVQVLEERIANRRVRDVMRSRISRLKRSRPWNR